MSEEQLKAFLEQVKSDTSLQEKLKGADCIDAVVRIAKEAGFSLSTIELTEAYSGIEDRELETAAGGGCAIYGNEQASQAEGMGRAIGTLINVIRENGWNDKDAWAPCWAGW